MLRNLFSRMGAFASRRAQQRAQDTAPQERKGAKFYYIGFKVQQSVRFDGTHDWAPNGLSGARIGDVVQFRTEYQNLGGGAQEHIVMELAWAEGLKFVPGSVRFYNASCPDGISIPDPNLAYYGKGGAGFAFDLGTYEQGASACLQFSAVITEAERRGRACFAHVKTGGVTLSSTTVIELVGRVPDSATDGDSTKLTSGSIASDNSTNI